MVSLWAEPDRRGEGIWVPVFSGSEGVSEYAERESSSLPCGRHLQWMRHKPGQLFGLLQSIPCFAGIYLHGDEGGRVRIDWPEVQSLSEKRVPADAPVLYALPVESYTLPEGTKCLWGDLDGFADRLSGKQVIFPQAEKPDLQDFRRLVRLNLEGEDPVWTPCRHFVSAARRFMEDRPEDAALHLDVLVRSLVRFEMFGEAEGVCRGLVDGRHAAFAMTTLSQVLKRIGRLEDCIEVCREGLGRFPEERLFYVNQALAHAQMEDLELARNVAKKGAELFPADPALRRFL